MKGQQFRRCFLPDRGGARSARCPSDVEPDVSSGHECRLTGRHAPIVHVSPLPPALRPMNGKSRWDCRKATVQIGLRVHRADRTKT